jgi:protein tyrosine/serine phosphatase
MRLGRVLIGAALRRTALTLGLVVVLVGGWAGYLRLSGNFHAVEEGILYRSAQLSLDQFERKIRGHGIKTVINLRGENSSEDWYKDELRAASATAVRHIDFPLSAVTEVSDEKLAKLTELLRDSPRPILVHCEGGADRSGLASALFELMIEKRPVSVAAEQLSLRYGHFPWLGNRTVAMDKSFERLATKEGQPTAAANITSD